MRLSVNGPHGPTRELHIYTYIFASHLFGISCLPSSEDGVQPLLRLCSVTHTPFAPHLLPVGLSHLLLSPAWDSGDWGHLIGSVLIHALPFPKFFWCCILFLLFVLWTMFFKKPLYCCSIGVLKQKKYIIELNLPSWPGSPTIFFLDLPTLRNISLKGKNLGSSILSLSPPCITFDLG